MTGLVKEYILDQMLVLNSLFMVLLKTSFILLFTKQLIVDFGIVIGLKT